MRPAILFGAFDRHNLGDMLFPHVVQRLLGNRPTTLAGLVHADLRACGGHRVMPVEEAIASHGDVPLDLIHVGGEILTCSAWQAAIMSLPPPEALPLLRRPEPGLPQRRTWAVRRLGCSRLAPYVLSADHLPPGSRSIFLGVGGTDLAEAPPDLRDEVLRALAQASFTGVRDRRTLAALQSASIPASLMPDTAVAAPELLADDIARHARTGEPARVRDRFPRGYLAVQFSADFGDDRTLAQLTAQLDATAARTNLGIVYLRTGTAPLA